MGAVDKVALRGIEGNEHLRTRIMADSALPTGLVTFLFTDIEGSTRLFHRLGEIYPDLLEKHQSLLRSVWKRFKGHEVGTEGDSFLVAFGSADDAIKAAAEAQRALVHADWPPGGEVKVRMGMHSGFATPRGDNYVSMAIHQASRVIETAHGGQIVVTQDTEFLTTPELEERLRPLGLFRIRDFPHRVRLYQVVGEGLEDDFPTLKATPADQHNIIPRPTETIGREEDIAAVARLVQQRRTVTLTGPGGVGKTRLAADVGLRIAPGWEDGVWLVELASVHEPDLVPGAVAEAIGADLNPTAARTDDVLHHLETRRAVVILDNCEHVIEAASALIHRIHESCERVAVIATSREPLHLPGEILWPVHPLPVPDMSGQFESVIESASGKLFRERGQAVRPGFEIDESNAAVISRLVRHLDGLPLLIELAAAHLSARSPSEILKGLEQSFQYLQSRDPRISDRHRTVGGLMGWSYQLLSDQEQTAFRRLSVFAADFTEEMAAVAIADGDVEIGTADELVWSLVDRSLIEPDFESEDTRYRLLETLRDYGIQLAGERDEASDVALRLAKVFMANLGPWKPTDGSWVGDVSVDIDNLRGLIPLIPHEDQDLAQQIACTIGRYHDTTQTILEGIEELSRLCEVLDKASPARVSLLTILADLYLRTGEIEPAARLVGMAAELESQYGHPDWDDVAVDRSLGEITRRRGDLAGAIDIARNSLDRGPSDRGQARMYNLLGTTSAALGDFKTAYEACNQELELMEQLGYEGYVASAHGNLAEIALRLGDLSEAARHQRICLKLALAQGLSAFVAYSLIVAARVAGWREEWATAVQLHTTAENQLRELGVVLYEDDRRESDELLDNARATLGDDVFASAKTQGLESSLTVSVDLADKVLIAAETGV